MSAAVGATTRVEDCTLVIPVKSFGLAKQRLSPLLSPHERSRLGRDLATKLVEANRSLEIVIVSDDDDVKAWAHAMDVRFLRESVPGLNRAVTTAQTELRRSGIRQMIVAHSDLASASSLSWTADFDGITIAPDRRSEGTNVLAIRTDVEFSFGYGSNSFRHHYRQAIATGLPVRVVADRACATDLDAPSDLRLLRRDRLVTVPR